MRVSGLVVSLLLGAVLVVGCGGRPASESTSEEPTPSAEGPQIRLVAFVGSASKPPSLEAKEAFRKLHPDITLDMTFGGSGTLLNQMVMEEMGDIYMPGSDDYMDRAEQKQAVVPETRRIVAYLIPTICVQHGNPKGIQSLADLARPGIVVGLAEAGAVCLGDVADEILRSAGLEKQVKKNVITYARSCEQAQQLVQFGEVDAVIGWDAFKHWAPDQIDIVNIAPEHLRVRNIPAAVSVHSKNREAAEKYIEFLTSDEGKAIFGEHGYSVEPPTI